MSSIVRGLLLLLLFVFAVWLFLELGDEVLEPEPIPLDDRILRALRTPDDPADPLGPWWLEEAMRDLTALGSTVVATLFSAAVVGGLFLLGRRRVAAVTFVAVFGGMGLAVLFKQLFARERPDVVPQLAEVGLASFPSGHSLISTVVYLTLGALLADLARSRALSAYVLAVALGVALIVGFTRVYLGVHYPSDVAGGWLLGVAWSLPWLVVLHRAGRRAAMRSDRFVQVRG